MVNRILIVDNSISNSDWTKANAFDFPSIKSLADFEKQMMIPSEPKARQKKLASYADKMWLESAPKDIYEAIMSASKKRTLVDLVKASFGGDRSEAGRYAANVRWQGQGGKSLKDVVDIGATKLGHRLGKDGEIHPLSLQAEIKKDTEKLTSGLRNRSEQLKSLVAENISEQMSDVTLDDMMQMAREDFTDTDFPHGMFEGRLDALFAPIRNSMKTGSKVKIFLATDGKVKVLKVPIKDSDVSWDDERFDYPSPEGEEVLRGAVISVLVRQWAISSNDANKASLAMQDIAQKLFKPDALSWDKKGSIVTDKFWWQEAEKKANYKATVTDLDKTTEKVLTSFLKAQYAITQKYFADKGIESVTLFRGQNSAEWNEGDAKTTLLMRPLSSWSTNPTVALSFATESGGYEQSSKIVKTKVEVKNILSIPLTGQGCYTEDEVVVIGRSLPYSSTEKGATRVAPAKRYAENSAPSFSNPFYKWAYEDEQVPYEKIVGNNE